MNIFSNINWIVRLKNPVFITQLVLAILVPILAYFGLNLEDLTTWNKVGEILLGAISNPFILGTVIVSVAGVINDPTTSGITDSAQALSYTEPKES